MKLRLAAWNLAVLGLVLAVVVGAAIVSEIRASDAAFEQDLRRGAARVSARFDRVVGDEREDDDDDDDDRALPGDVRELLVVARRAGSERTIANRRVLPPGIPDEAALDAALAGAERRSERASGDTTVKLLTVPVLREGHVVGAVQVGKSTDEARRALARTIAILALTGALGLVLAGSGGVFLAGRAMRPITDALERQRRFVADASHELRTPVAVLRARAELVARGPAAVPEAVSSELARLEKDADELAALLDDLLDLARIDAAQAALRAEPIALGDAVEETVAQLAPLAAARDIELAAKVEPVFARADLARTRQVLRALIDNAIKHGRAGGHVRVEVAASRGRARVRVVDDGEGIAKEHLPHVFDRFYRADEARARGEARGGTGLGLAIAAELVRLMGGAIHVESEPGRGSTFEIELPLP